MSFRDCMLSAVEQGEITRTEADDLLARFDETTRRRAYRLATKRLGRQRRTPWRRN